MPPDVDHLTSGQTLQDFHLWEAILNKVGMGSKASDRFEYVKQFFNEPPPISTEDLVNPETVRSEQNSAGGGAGSGVVPRCYVIMWHF